MMHRIQQLAIPTKPNTIHGFIFDLAVFASNIVFALTILDRTENLPDMTIGWLLGLAVITHLIGAILKSNPLKYRMGETTGGSSAGILRKFMDVPNSSKKQFYITKSQRCNYLLDFQYNN